MKFFRSNQWFQQNLKQIIYFRQRAGRVDSVIVPAVRNFLFKPKNEFFGGDLGNELYFISIFHYRTYASSQRQNCNKKHPLMIFVTLIDKTKLFKFSCKKHSEGSRSQNWILQRRSNQMWIETSSRNFWRI
jgi:hypothetical protein